MVNTAVKSPSVPDTAEGYFMSLDTPLFHGVEEHWNHTPRQLRLEQCAFPWNSPWLGGLTALHLQDIPKTHGLTMAMLLSVVIASPLLQQLTLVNTQTRVDSLDRVFPIDLCDLRIIHLSEPISRCWRISLSRR